MKMNGYYTEKLSAERLRRCYEIAPPRVRQYLEAEIQHVLRGSKPKIEEVDNSSIFCEISVT